MKTKKGFTLIELLVVISIIALLLSILMPSLQKVKEQAKTIVCASQLRQQGIGFVSYSTDHFKYPKPILPGWWPFGGLGWNDASVPLADTDTRWQPSGLAALFIADYLKDPEFFFCPAASKKWTAPGRPLVYEIEWKGYYDTWGPNGADVYAWFTHVYSGYPYWVGYKSGSALYDEKFEKDIAQNHTSRSESIIITDSICTYDPPGGAGTYEDAEKDPVFANHVVGGELTGGNILYNDASVKWQKMKPLIENGDKHWRLRIVQGKGFNFWF